MSSCEPSHVFAYSRAASRAGERWSGGAAVRTAQRQPGAVTATHQPQPKWAVATSAIQLHAIIIQATTSTVFTAVIATQSSTSATTAAFQSAATARLIVHMTHLTRVTCLSHVTDVRSRDACTTCHEKVNLVNIGRKICVKGLVLKSLQTYFDLLCIDYKVIKSTMCLVIFTVSASSTYAPLLPYQRSCYHVGAPYCHHAGAPVTEQGRHFDRVGASATAKATLLSCRRPGYRVGVPAIV